jgi:RNA polymerase sigma factor (sigma-70 family)
MEDSAIIDLYWAREERALAESDAKYGSYCRTVAYNILRCREDTEECVNDTWLRAWNAMPPQRPGILSSFLAKITRNLSLDRYKAGRADKRGGGQLPLALDELGDCIPDSRNVEDVVELKELSRVLDRFLRSLPEREACVFLRRYWFVDSTKEIALRYGMAEGSVKSTLHRTRGKLRACLEKEGIAL